MRKHWKKLVAILGAAVLVVCQSKVPVRAAELPVGEGTQMQKETANEGNGAETAVTEDGNTDGEKTEETKKPQLIEITEFYWSEKGEAVFRNPNEKSYFRLPIYKESNGKYEEIYVWEEYGYFWLEGEVTCDLYHIIMEAGAGDYKFKVQAVRNGFLQSEESDFSGVFHYERPETQLPAPIANVNREGLVTCTLPEGSSYQLGQDYGFNYKLYQWENGDYKQVHQMGTNQNSYDFSQYMELGNIYYVKVQTLTRDCLKWNDSAWSDYMPVDPDSVKNNSDNTSNEDFQLSSGAEAEDTEAVPDAEWKPATPDEIKQYAANSREKAEYTADARNAYTVVVQNAMQGKKCFDSFEAVLGDYTIGRTYNILPYGKVAYKMDSKARITLSIPKTLQAWNRDFKMVCVTADGVPVVLNDLDLNPETVTFETDVYYAFALVYKDVAVV